MRRRSSLSGPQVWEQLVQLCSTLERNCLRHLILATQVNWLNQVPQLIAKQGLPWLSSTELNLIKRANPDPHLNPHDRTPLMQEMDLLHC